MTPFTAKSLCHPVVYSIGSGDDLVALVLVGQTSFVTSLVWSLPVFGDKLSCEAVVQRRNGRNLLRDDDDDYIDVCTGRAARGSGRA